MRGGAFGFSRKEIMWFALILLSSLIIALVCIFRIFNKLYWHSDESGARIRDLSSEVLHLQEASMHAVSIQRSSLNLIIYANNKAELENVKTLIDKNRDTLLVNLAAFEERAIMPEAMAKEVAAVGKDYLAANEEYRTLCSDSSQNSKAADFNVQKMRPALRKFTDLIRLNSMTLTGDIQKTSENKVNLFALYEFWILIALALPCLYLFYRFVRLFIKLLLMDARI